MNEAMLTGESIPVVKNPLPINDKAYSPVEEGKQSTLLAGTKCIETRYFKKKTLPILAIVSKTGFNTLKGELVRTILFPKQNYFSFHNVFFKIKLSGLSQIRRNYGDNPADLDLCIH